MKAFKVGRIVINYKTILVEHRNTTFPKAKYGVISDNELVL